VRTRRGPRLSAGAGLVVVVAAVLAGFLWFRVCDEQVTSAGRVVTVCRHLATTDPPVVVLGLVALLLLSVFYAEISGFGVTLRRRVAELGERSDELRETVGDLAEFNRERVVPSMVTDVEFEADEESEAGGRVPDARIADLAGRYDTLRWTMPSGRERTRRMSEVTRQMEEALRDADDFDLAGHLAHHDRGVRLAAYAYLRTHTVPGLMTALVDAAATEEKPFGQYSALRAARHQRDMGVPLSDRDRGTLRAMRDRVGASADRGQLITALLDEDPLP
jgi:hypothetical protein